MAYVIQRDSMRDYARGVLSLKSAGPAWLRDKCFTIQIVWYIYPRYDRIAIRGLNSKGSFIEDLYAINWADLELGLFCSRDLSRVLLSQFGWQERIEVPNFAYHRVVACESSEHVGICKEKINQFFFNSCFLPFALISAVETCGKAKEDIFADLIDSNYKHCWARYAQCGSKFWDKNHIKWKTRQKNVVNIFFIQNKVLFNISLCLNILLL